MLAGVRVVELATTITGPLATMLLGDLGADIIKIERPGGDPFRNFRGGLYGPYFCAYNRNKRSVVLDFAHDDGRKQALELIDGADVVLDNYRPGVLERLGLGSDVLRARNEGLIHCSITGFGASGPYSDRPAYDAVAQALSGISSLFLDPEDPRVTGPTIADNVTGMYAALAVVSALYERQAGGPGRRIEINMFECAAAFVPDAFANLTQLGIRMTPTTRAAASQSYAFKCADGKLLAIHLSSLDKFWTDAVDALHAPELDADARFTTRMDRLKNYDALRELLAARIATRPRSEWLVRFAEFDFPYAPINSIEEVLADPQLAALDAFYETAHPTEGAIRALHAPYIVDGARITASRPPPTLGEHNGARWDEQLAR
jgi:crotonobetainyl-CoA:carnitine CoA-transferase CaiB-like acyl-CoA transferase